MAEDKQLDRQQSYHHFHLGVYIALCTLVTTASIFASKAMQDAVGGKGAPVLFLLLMILSAMCGGIVAAKIPQASSYKSFLASRIGFTFPFTSWVLFPMKPKEWEALEHLLFWIAILVYPGLLALNYIRPQ
ncbi:hypothetical protein AS593_21525 [Caulobacter vibrioides]|nr:hypothetical protein AS593_21525 [Caulobacter vibrioides]